MSPNTDVYRSSLSQVSGVPDRKEQLQPFTYTRKVTRLHSVLCDIVWLKILRLTRTNSKVHTVREERQAAPLPWKVMGVSGN